MANTAEASNDVSTAPAKAGFPAVPFLIAVIMAVLLGIAATGGVAFWLLKTGKLPSLAAAAITVKSASAADSGPPKSHPVKLEPLLVNLADPGGQSYLRLTINLVVLDPPPVKGKKVEKAEEPKKGAVVADENEAPLRDAALTVLGRETSDELLAPDGKEELKAKLKTAMSAHLPELKITEVFFTEFLVQH